MCVQTANKNWERPATIEDAKILETHFKRIDLSGFLQAMQQDFCIPLVTDLALIGAVLTSKENEFGVKFLPFTALEIATKTCVKIPEMENIVDWMENTALGSHMWTFANKFAEEKYGMKFTFFMDCGCGAAPISKFSDGSVAAWNKKMNLEAKTVFGKTNVVYRDDINGTNMNILQREMWQKIRISLESLSLNENNIPQYFVINQKKYEENILR